MIQKAIVKKKIDEQHVEIEVQRQSACGHDCANCGGCGAPKERIQAIAVNAVHANVGDVVTIEGKNSEIMRMAAVVYAVPLLLFFAFFAVACLCGLSEGIAGIFGCLGVVCGIFGAISYNKRVKQRGATPFTIIKKG